MSQAKRRTKSEADPDTGKRLRTGIYRAGEQTLFVPTIKMHEARALFPSAPQRPPSRWAKGVNISAVERAVARGAVAPGVDPNFATWYRTYAGTHTISAYFERYRRIAWYSAWQTGGDAPENVHIASKADVRHAKSAWAYGEILEALGHGRSEYQRFFAGKSRFPVEQIEEFMLWLYGGAEPAGWIIVPEWVVHLRHELTATALCATTGLMRSTYRCWKRVPLRRKALLDAIAAVRTGREKPVDSEAWGCLFGDASTYRKPTALPRDVVANATRRLARGEDAAAVALSVGISIGTCRRIRNGSYGLKNIAAPTLRMADAMLKFAKAARESEAVQRVRANFETCGSTSELRRRAKESGSLDALNEYINAGLANIALDVDVTKNGEWHRRGVLAPGLYLPTPLMREFRVVASARCAENRISMLTRTPCFRLWFLDWALPLTHLDRASPYRKGFLRPGSAYRNDPLAPPAAATPDNRQPDPIASAAATAPATTAPTHTVGNENTTSMDRAWAFDPGEARIGSRKIRISGTQWALLKAFYDSPRRLTIEDLRSRVWDGYMADEKTIRSTMTHVRNALRKQLGLDSQSDPIPVDGRGRLASWALDRRLCEAGAARFVTQL